MFVQSSSNTKGILFMVSAIFCLSMMDGFTRYLTDYYNVIAINMFRYFFLFLFVILINSTKNKSVVYVAVETFNLYTNEKVVVVVAKELLSSVFCGPYVEESDLSDDKKQVPYKVVREFKGSELIGLKYEQLLAVASPAENAENAFQVIHGDFVSTEDGTGIVHIAPTFGVDDAQVAKDSNVPNAGKR